MGSLGTDTVLVTPAGAPLLILMDEATRAFRLTLETYADKRGTRGGEQGGGGGGRWKVKGTEFELSTNATGIQSSSFLSHKWQSHLPHSDSQFWNKLLAAVRAAEVGGGVEEEEEEEEAGKREGEERKRINRGHKYIASSAVHRAQ